MDPFRLFPEEIWMTILENVEDSEDAWNMFRAFPQLDNNSRLQKRKHLWLFGLVIPHLAPWKRVNWINEKELLNCRMACKRWSSDVDRFLENQPQLRAYRPEEPQETGKLFWNTKPYYDKMDIFGDDDDEDDFIINIRLPRQVPYFGGTYLKFPDEDDKKPSWPSKFLIDMDGHPPGRSPFLSRSLSISLPDSHVGRHFNNMDKARNFWNDLAAIHLKFGDHVWNYELGIPVHRDDQFPLPDGIARCLSHLPNLRCLSISAHDGYSEYTDEDLDELIASCNMGLYPLPKLETLRIHTPFEKVGHPLITRFSGQIRRLEISVCLWRSEYRQIFPKLTELRVMVRSREQVAILKDLLMSLEAPQLAKFQLHAREFSADNGRGRIEYVNCGPLVMEDDVFEWLRRFPNLEYLDLGEKCELLLQLEERNTLSPDVDSMPSLKFLSIRTSPGLSYNFLLCLPSLQHLHLYVIREPGVHDNSGNPGGLRIREEILHADMLKSNVWELLPTLRTIALLQDTSIGKECVLDLEESWAFNREEYNHARREEMNLKQDETKPIREDIEMYLRYNCGFY